MAKWKKTAARSGDPFIEASGQMRLMDKSAEQRAVEEPKVECLGMTFESDETRRAYFLGKLREKLKDPEFRKIEGFPIGSDEDILAMSNAPCYTACPNPFLEAYSQRPSAASRGVEIIRSLPGPSMSGQFPPSNRVDWRLTPHAHKICGGLRGATTLIA